MGLIASSPCCRPRMAPVIWGLHLVLDPAVKYQTDGLITGAFMMRKIALKIQWGEPPGVFTTGRVNRRREESNTSQLAKRSL